MAEISVLKMDTQSLVQAWQNTLPEIMKSSDECHIQADQKFPDTLLIHIKDDGRSHYSFDFRCKYVDEREVQVEFLDVEQDNKSIDEQTSDVQLLIEEYIRNIHECAQRLKDLTKGV